MIKHGHRAMPPGTPERQAYDAWRNMRRRCSNKATPNYADYGGRGIYFDPAWSCYSQFLMDMGIPQPGMSLDRIDNSGPYCKSNCKWSSRDEQNTNKRNNRVIGFMGQQKTLSQWARAIGVKSGTLLGRLDHGWPLERALTPARFHRSGKVTPMMTLV